MKKRYTTVLLSVLFFWGCDNASTDPETQNNSSDANSSPVPEVTEPEVASEPLLPKIALPSPPTVPLEVSEGPQAPAFTEELLASVNNWTAVPPSVFPLSGVTLKQPLNFEIKRLPVK